MGVASKAILVALRIWQLFISVIVLGILARFFRYSAMGGAARDGRIIYGIIVASLSTLASLVFIAPFMYSFWAFPVDFALFVMWLILFCLLITRTGVNTCSASWFNYWAYYWGEWWRRPGPFVRTGCGAWRTALGFSFMAMLAFLASAILGAIVVGRRFAKNRREKRGLAGNPQTSQVDGAGQPGSVGGTGPGAQTGQPST